MSLISDLDYLIHGLRLSYLRDVEDIYGPRLITLDPSYNSNPFIVAASLADPERWPELEMPSSPHLSEDESERPSGFPGARLKHTETIMGKRSGVAGMRVHGKRASTSKRISSTPRQHDVQNYISANAPVQDALSSSVPVTSTTPLVKPPTDDKTTQPSSLNVQVQVQGPTVVDDAPVQKVVQFVPKFKGAAEMEARRRVRMAARRAPPPATNATTLVSHIDFDSSDEEIPPVDSSSESDVDDDVPGEDSMDEGDDYDFGFAAGQTTTASDSDMLSIISNDSIPTSPDPLSPYQQTRMRTGSRHSTVSEDEKTSPKRTRAHGNSQPTSAHNRQENRKHEPFGPSLRDQVPSPASAPLLTEALFMKKQVQPASASKSSLSTMLASADASSNPFAEIYASVSGRGESASEDVIVYFPHAVQPKDKPMQLNVRKDATVEEVIGFALWSYWKEGWLPRLDEGLSEGDPKWDTKVSAVGWILRIAEEDGEVDDDFPPPDRLGRVSKFNADAYAVLEATPTQIQQNQLIASKIQRSPSRITKKAEKSNVLVPSVSTGAPSSAILGSSLGSLPLSTSLGPSSSHGPPIFLRIRVADTADAVHISTTIPVSAGMYMQEALELVCRKRKLANPNDYALLLADMSILIPLDRTVASLQGKRELLLLKRSMLPQLGADILKGAGKTTDPNASIFKRMSDTPEVQYPSLSDYTAGYKRFTIFRKAPMLLARQERALAIDGTYIHIMPSTNKAMKAVFDTGKTSSYHIKSIVDCQQPIKTSPVFKLVLNRGGTNKRYDFEAESPRLAGELVQMIKGLKTLERTGTVNKSRRSRHVG